MNAPERLHTATHFRTLWLSDIHLGFPGARAEALLDFVRAVRCETLYLVGDIVDFRALKKRRHWPQAHNDVVRSLLGKAKHDTRVVYVPGNHDTEVRDFVGLVLGNVEIRDRLIHRTVDGRELLVLHGDQFDAAVRHSRLAALLGSAAYDSLLWASRMLDRARDALADRTGRWPRRSSRGSAGPGPTSSASKPRRPARPAASASTAWSAATFTARRCRSSTVGST